MSTEKFKALSPVQFLTELICRKHPVGIETQGLVLEHPDIVPIEALFGEGRDPNAEVDYRRLLADADLIFGVDVMSGKQSILFGRLSLEELVRTGQSNILGVVNVGLDQETMEIEKLATLVQDIKGHHDYCGAGADSRHRNPCRFPVVPTFSWESRKTTNSGALPLNVSEGHCCWLSNPRREPNYS